MHNVDLILTLTTGLGAALALGFLAFRLGLNPIVGYLMAGLLVGPHTPGVMANHDIAAQLAEVGVILLMFGVGLHFRLQDLLAVRGIAITGALVQIAAVTPLGILAGMSFGWSFAASALFGISLSIASTVVLTRVLADHSDLQSQTGKISIGWLVLEDIISVFVLVILPTVFGAGDRGDITMAIGVAALKLAALTAVILGAGGRLIPRFLTSVTKTHSRELFTLTVLVIALGISVAAAKIFGVSMALGAFLAGVVVGQSEFSYRAASEALPMRDAFAVLFFVSVGMLFNPEHLFRAPLQIILTTAIIVVAKPVAAFVIVIAFGYGSRIGVRVALARGQIGEFSFILATLGGQLGILPAGATDSLVAASIASITLNPVFYRLSPWFDEIITRIGFLRRLCAPRVSDNEGTPKRLASRNRAVIVGYGPVGQTVSELLRLHGIESTVIELNLETVRRLNSEGVHAVYGDAMDREVLTEAGVATALGLILSAPASPESAELIRAAREMNPGIRVLVRCKFLSLANAMRGAGADEIFSGEAEVAMGMIEYILNGLGTTPEQMDLERSRFRKQLYGPERLPPA